MKFVSFQHSEYEYIWKQFKLQRYWFVDFKYIYTQNTTIHSGFIRLNLMVSEIQVICKSFQTFLV